MTQEIKITVPEGYEIDRENSTFECVKFKKKGLTYKDVCNALFLDKDTYFVGTAGTISHMVSKGDDVYSPNNASSVRQLDRILAINKLLNVAEYFNSKHPAEEGNLKFYLYYNGNAKDIAVAQTTAVCNRGAVLFNYAADALSAIKILGENVVLQALGVF